MDCRFRAGTGDERLNLAGLVAIVAEDNVAMQIVAAGVRRPLIANERREMARIIGLFGCLDGFLPRAAIGACSGKGKQRLRKSALREGNDHLNAASAP